MAGGAAPAEPGGQAHHSQQECAHLRCAQPPLSAGGRGPDRHPRPACQYRANDALGNWPGPADWPNAKAFCSWLGLAPHHEISGGKILRRSTLKTRNRAGQAFRLAAQAVSRSHNSLGAYYRRMRARFGPKAAIVATAHKLARIVYHLLTHRTPYRDRSAEEYEQQARQREIVTLRQKAAKLGLALVESPA